MEIARKTVAAMRGLAMDAINQAGQGHMGMALGAAPILYALYADTLRLSRADPKWPDRDRFVMSAGHGSMALYAIAHFMGLLSEEDVKNHKQLHSRTPAHPETGATPFVDASTGPLGQGLAMAVGMALSQKYLAGMFNRDGFKVFDHHVFALIGDACVQEGVGQEAVQLAGTWNLDRLVVVQDFNDVQIDSPASEVNALDAPVFFASCGFDVNVLEDDDPAKIAAALARARVSGKPSFIRVPTTIAYGTPLAGKPAGHNGTLPPEQTAAFKRGLGLGEAEPFVYDRAVYDHGASLWATKERSRDDWVAMMANYASSHPDLHRALSSLLDGSAEHALVGLAFKERDVATRNYIGAVVKHLESDPFVIGGSADLTAATKVGFARPVAVGGKNVRYGVREFAMAAINNGVWLDCGLRTVDGTFLVFADYAKAAYRLGAIMGVPAIHVLTHDSYQVGGDGPTHQPVEQLAMLRAMPGGAVYRPADGAETALSFTDALRRADRQAFIVGCRQPVPSFDMARQVADLKGYVVFKGGKGALAGTFVASGSEVGLAVAAASKLADEMAVQVVSVPCLQDLLSDERHACALGLRDAPIFAAEASSDSAWFRLGAHAPVAMLDASRYGHSAPGQQVYELMGFTPVNLAERARAHFAAFKRK